MHLIEWDHPKVTDEAAVMAQMKAMYASKEWAFCLVFGDTEPTEMAMAGEVALTMLPHLLTCVPSVFTVVNLRPIWACQVLCIRREVPDEVFEALEERFGVDPREGSLAVFGAHQQPTVSAAYQERFDACVVGVGQWLEGAVH